MSTPIPLPTRDDDRRALAAVAVQFFANGAMAASFIARGPQFRDQLGISVDDFGLYVTLGAMVAFGASAFVGRVLTVLSTRRVLHLGSIALVLALPVIGTARNTAVWLIAVSVFLFVDVFVDIAMNLQGSWISGRRHTPVMNRLHGLWSLGTFAGGIGAVAANAAGLSTFTHLTIVTVVIGLALASVTNGLLRTDESADEPADEVSPTAAPRRRSVSKLVLLASAGMFAVVSEITGGDWSTFRLADDFDATPALASLAFVAYTGGMTAMRVGGDFLQSRLGGTRLHRLAVGLATVGFLLAAVVPVRALALVGFLVAGAGVATFMPKLYDDAARLPGRRGDGLGALTAGLRCGFLLTPVGVGALAGTSLSVGSAIAVITLPCLVGFAIVSEVIRRRTERPIRVEPLTPPTSRAESGAPSPAPPT